MQYWDWKGDTIRDLEVDEVFVFGSNVQGRNAGGAAAQASAEFGAEDGVGEGLTGRCYALPTVDFSGRNFGIDEFAACWERFLETARQHAELKFLVTAVGTGIAKRNFEPGAIVGHIAQTDVPANVYFDPRWRGSLGS